MFNEYTTSNANLLHIIQKAIYLLVDELDPGSFNEAFVGSDKFTIGALSGDELFRLELAKSFLYGVRINVGGNR